VKPAQTIAKLAPTQPMGLFAPRCGLLHRQGGGARKTGRILILSVFTTVLGVMALAAAPVLAATPETPETGKASAVTSTTTTLEDGVLNPHVALGELAEYEYRFRVSETECEGESSTAGMALGNKQEAVPPVDLTDLQPNAHYTFCLLERSLATGETSLPSTPTHFTTKAAPPTVAAPPSTSIAPTEAHLEGLVNPNNQSTECHVQYGTDASLATKTTVGCEPESLEGYGAQGSLTLSGLTQATTYYYRVIAKNTSGEEKGAIELFTTDTPEPPETGDATPITATEAALHGVLNPRHDGAVGTYEFVYRQSASECLGEGEEKAPEPAEAATGDSPEPVEATIAELLPGMPYTFCLLGRNTAEEAAVGKPVTFMTLAVPPTITSESVSSVETTAATLEAEVDPGGAATTYRFEYLTEAQFGANGETFIGATTTPQSTSIGAGDTAHSISARITSLQPSTTYHYRVVAANVESPVGGTPGPGKILTTPPAPGSVPARNCRNEQLRAEQPFGLALPDCRAYEMVSPEETGGQDATDSFIDANARASEAKIEEPAITYASKGSFGSPAGAAATDQFVSRRNAGKERWETQAVTPLLNPESTVNFSSFEATVFNPELTAGIAATDASLSSTEAPENERLKLYASDFATDSYQYVGLGLTPLGASTNLSHVIFGENSAIEPVSEWVNGEVMPVSVTNEGAAIEAAVGSQHTTGVSYHHDVWHAVSENGSRVYFTSPASVLNAESGGPGALYVRVNAEQPQSKMSGGTCLDPNDACTVEVSPAGATGARYWGASADGTKVFFTREGNLYEYSLSIGQTVGQTTALTEAGEVQGVVQISEEGTYVYFVAKGLARENNLYVSHEGSTPTFIATLTAGDETDWQGGTKGSNGEGSGPEINTAVVNPSGARLAFLSQRSLPTTNFSTGYDNTASNGTNCGENSRGEPGPLLCTEIFEYDAVTSQLVCASCNPTGARPVGPASFSSFQNASYQESAQYRPRNLLEDGTLFFDSSDALVPHASDGRQNVYEYEDGHVYAISNAAGGDESFFLDASPSGEDVFFGSADQLLKQDTGDNVVVWDARQDGGFPVSPSAPACDNADSCKPPELSLPAIFGTPASATFSGPGNTTPAAPAVVTQKKKKKAAELRAEKLAKALKSCRKDKKKSKRAKCESQARRKYGARAKKAKRVTNDRRADR
jgi:hypothetical protein